MTICVCLGTWYLFTLRLKRLALSVYFLQIVSMELVVFLRKLIGVGGCISE